MFLRDEPDTPSRRQARMPELFEDYKAHRVRLISQARELERLRQQVRASAEREAAAIVTTARRNVRQVLLDARHELLVLVAQVQAVGCDTPAEGAANYVVEGEATARSIASGASPDAADGGAGGGDIVNGARRDVREVLLEAQTELLALAEEARELRARIARQHIASRQSAPLEFSSEDERNVAAVAEPLAPAPSEAQTDGEDARAGYIPVPPVSRIWIPIAAAVLFAAVGLGVFLRSAARDASGGVTPTPSSTADRTQASSQRAAQPAPSAAVPPLPAAAPDPSVLAVTIDVRRPAWIRTTIDGRADVGRLFNAGETRTVTAKEEIVMRAGDAGAVFVSVNGSEAKALGRDGGVVTRRFGSSAAHARKPAVLQASAASEAPANPSVESASADVGTTGTRETPSAPTAAAAEREILRAAQQWFEAYFGGDAAGMKDIEAAAFALVDDRAPGQRVSATMPGVERGLQQLQIEVAGDGAVMSARLTERAPIDGRLREYVSLVSGVWIRTDGRWRLTGLRFIDAAALARPL